MCLSLFIFAQTGDLGQSVKAGAIAGYSSYAFSQIGAAFENPASFTDVAAFVGSHGIVGGVMSALQGGDFGDGFVSAGVGKIVTLAGGAAGVKLNDTGKFITTVLAAGTASELTGGKFANGAATAGLAFAANHLVNDDIAESERRGLVGKLPRLTGSRSHSHMKTSASADKFKVTKEEAKELADDLAVVSATSGVVALACTSGVISIACAPPAGFIAASTGLASGGINLLIDFNIKNFLLSQAPWGLGKVAKRLGPALRRADSATNRKFNAEVRSAADHIENASSNTSALLINTFVDTDE